MRKLFIFTVFCFAVYSCAMHVEVNTDIARSYIKPRIVLKKNTPSVLSQNKTVEVKEQKKVEEKTEQKTEEATVKQTLDEQTKEENKNSNKESSIQENLEALLDVKIIATMTPEKLKKIISKGADVNAKSKNGSTVLMLYSVLSSTDIIQILLDNGADINAANSQGGTALMGACQKNTKEVINLLLQKGANPFSRTSKGKTALDFLDTNKNLSVEDKISIYDIVIQKSQ